MKKIKNWFIKQRDILKEEFTNEPISKILQNYFYILLGALVVAFGEAFLFIPMNIIAGGVSSISILLSKTPYLSVISVEQWVTIVTWFFFFLGLILLGVKYAYHTLIYTIFYPLFVALFNVLIENVCVDGRYILDITQCFNDIIIESGVIEASKNETAFQLLAYIVSAIMGGIICGAGIGLTLAGGGSSGGTDVINLLANRYLHIKVGTSSFCCDAVLIILGFFANGYNLLASLVGLIGALLCSIMIDKVFIGSSQYYMANVISSKWSEINDFINIDLGRGTTLVKSRGGYTKEDSLILQVCFDRRDYNIIRDTINRIDPNAFVTVVQTKEVLGYGFSFSRKSDDEGITITAEEARKLVNKAHTKKKKTFKD